MFTFTLLTPGDGRESSKAALLTIDNDIQILADPSWNGKNPGDLEYLKPHLAQVKILLLSHSTPEFLSGYVMLCVKFPDLMSEIKVYATTAVSQLGRVSTVEFYRSLGIIGPLKDALLETSDVDTWFDKVMTAKYMQTSNVFERLAVTPYNSGHTLGGCFWLITRKLEKIIYAPSWNHSKDSFLNAAGFLSSANGNPLSQLMRPTALITSTDLGSSMPHKKRTEKFLQLVDATLANGGAVLLPTSLSGRFLELLHLVDEHLQSAPIPVLFLSYSGTNVLRYASNLLEWMSNQLSKELENANSIGSNAANRNHYPFDPSKVDLVANANELVRRAGPKIVFTSGVDLRGGDLSSQALKALCQDEKTTIILTEKTHFGYDNTVNAQLYREWFQLCKKRNDGVIEDGVAVPLEKSIVFNDWITEEELTGHELIEFREKINLKRQQKLIQEVRNRKNQNLLTGENFDEDELSSDEEEEEEDDEETNDTEATEVEVKKEADDEVKGTENSNGNGNAIKTEEPIIETKDIKAEIAETKNLMDDAATQEALIAEKTKVALEHNLPLDIKITHKLRPRQAMFPYFPNKQKQDFDDYGAIIDPKKFEKKEDTNNQITFDDKSGDNKRRWGNNDPMDDNQNRLTPQEVLNNEIIKKNLDTLFLPRKRITKGGSYGSGTKQTVMVRCGLSYVDLSGLVDLRSLGLIVSSLKPSNLILLPDTSVSDESDEESGLVKVKAMLEQQKDEATEAQKNKSLFNSTRFMSLASIRTGLSSSFSSGKTSSVELITAERNATIKIGNDDGGVNLGDFEVKIDDAIIENIKWQTIDGSYRVAQVHGQLEIQNKRTDNPGKKRKVITDYINPTSEFTLKYVNKAEYQRQLGTQLASTTRSGLKLAIGNIRLPELKKRLMSRNLQAEFKSEGTLVVNDVIAIRKITYGSSEDDTGDIVIDGQVGPLYYTVKDCIRELLAYM